MNTLLSQIILVFISVIFGGFFTFFITSLTQRKVFRSIAEELTQYHEKIYHRVPIEDLINKHKIEVDIALKEHINNCSAIKDVSKLKTDVSKLKTGVIWLVSQAGGNPIDLGLN